MSWEDRPLDEILEEPIRNGIYKKAELRGRGSPIIKMGELFANDLIRGEADDRVVLNERDHERATLRRGDLLFARRSYVFEGSGKCSLLVAEPSEHTTFESSVIRARPDPERCFPRFLFYFFKSPEGRARMASIATRTAVSGIRGSDLARLPVPVPPLSSQQEIAAVLAAYDELIENNLRRIEILEEMAQAVYREWFVNFHFPGHGHVTLTDSPLGSIPDTWKVTPFSQLADFLNGFAFKPVHLGAWVGT